MNNKPDKITTCIDSFHFKKGEEYIDVDSSIEGGGYISIDLDTSKTFTFETEAEIDMVCNKLKELLRAIKKEAYQPPKK